jgi:hypothetical protein
MGSYSTIGMGERYQDLLRIVHLNLLRQSAPHTGILSHSAIFISSQDSYHPFASRNDCP